MPHRFVAPFVGVLQPRLEEVQARSKSCQNQHRHKQVEGHEPVQEQPRHTAVTAQSERSKGGTHIEESMENGHLEDQTMHFTLKP